MKNPRYANEKSGILIEQDNGVDIYVDAGELYKDAVAEKFGPIAPYVAPSPQPDPVPQTVSRFQALAALSQSGLLDQAKTLIAQGSEIDQLAWDNATEFRRSSPLINSMATELGLTPVQLDDLFRLAITIEA